MEILAKGCVIVLPLSDGLCQSFLEPLHCPPCSGLQCRFLHLVKVCGRLKLIVVVIIITVGRHLLRVDNNDVITVGSTNRRKK